MGHVQELEICLISLRFKGGLERYNGKTMTFYKILRYAVMNYFIDTQMGGVCQ